MAALNMYVCEYVQTNAQVQILESVRSIEYLRSRSSSSFTITRAQRWYRPRMQWRASAFYTHILILLLGRRNGLIHILTMWECVSVAYKPLTFICAEESNLFPSLSHAQSDSDGNLILNSWKISLFLHSSQSRECNASWCPTDKQIRLNPFNLFSVLRKLHII